MGFVSQQDLAAPGVLRAGAAAIPRGPSRCGARRIHAPDKALALRGYDGRDRPTTQSVPADDSGAAHRMTARNTTSAADLPTRHRLAVEAARMFAERGYHGTSVNDLAAALGIQKSSLYAHISHKADLLADIALAGAAAFHAALDALPDQAPPGER